MSGWTVREHGRVKIEHWSTSSQIKVIITKDEEVEQGRTEEQKLEFWLDYGHFSDLRKVIEQTDL